MTEPRGPVTAAPDGAGPLPSRARLDERGRLDALGCVHPSKPPIPADGVREEPDSGELWGLSFALAAEDWRALGGMDEAFFGYGGEETDLAARLAESGLSTFWVAGARAYHQHHPVSRPPVEHLVDIVRNASIYWRRWHEWPMSGWLDEFERQGRIIRRPGEIVLVATADGHETRA